MKRIFFFLGVFVSACGNNNESTFHTSEFNYKILCIYDSRVMYRGVPKSYYKASTSWIIEEKNGNIIKTPGECVQEKR